MKTHITDSDLVALASQYCGMKARADEYSESMPQVARELHAKADMIASTFAILSALPEGAVVKMFHQRKDG